jgi:mannose-6-phosphate isomerase class I
LYTSGKNIELRSSDQFLLPVSKPIFEERKYDIYPSFKINDNQIFAGFESLAEKIKSFRNVLIDGYNGVFFNSFQVQLDKILLKDGYKVSWKKTSDFYKPEWQIHEMTAPFLGGDDPLFGRRTTLVLEDFFIKEKFNTIRPDQDSDINILIGPGAGLTSWKGLLIYIDIPKNEIQYRSRAGSVSNLGTATASDPKKMYKCFYFVDWVVLNKHKKRILPSVNLFVDGQRPEMPVWMDGTTLRKSLWAMSHNVFRVRPWFEPGAWGGTWIKNNIPGLNRNVPNYAWSFELITPENGLLIESSSLLCEVSFDCLMFQHAEEVLGDYYPESGTDFPIRFDFLDTFDGGNLSLQCHPRPQYMKENFGERSTQEETYYILDTKDEASVFLGFRENIKPEIFSHDLEESFKRGKLFDPDKYILRHHVKKHDLLLIPYGTIHGSGKDNLVLEISTTPYIFTFKMYDWQRPDLDGKQRPLNIERGMANLFFDRKGKYVNTRLIARPELLAEGPDWKLFHLATHETHSYDVHRYHFRSVIDIGTDNKCLVMSLTEGQSINVETKNGFKKTFYYAETFVIPAAAQSVRITNNSLSGAVLVMAFMKMGNRGIKK